MTVSFFVFTLKNKVHLLRVFCVSCHSLSGVRVRVRVCVQARIHGYMNVRGHFARPLEVLTFEESGAQVASKLKRGVHYVITQHVFQGLNTCSRGFKHSTWLTHRHRTLQHALIACEVI